MPPEVGDPAHQPVKRVDLAHQMAFAEPADRRIAGHGADGGESMGDQRRLGAHARGRGGRLAAGMAAAHDDDIVIARSSARILRMAGLLAQTARHASILTTDVSDRNVFHVKHRSPRPAVPALRAK